MSGEACAAAQQYGCEPDAGGEDGRRGRGVAEEEALALARAAVVWRAGLGPSGAPGWRRWLLRLRSLPMRFVGPHSFHRQS